MFKLLVCLLLSTDVLVRLIYIINIIHYFMFCIFKPLQLVILIQFGTNATPRLSSYMIVLVLWDDVLGGTTLVLTLDDGDGSGDW